MESSGTPENYDYSAQHKEQKTEPSMQEISNAVAEGMADIKDFRKSLLDWFEDNIKNKENNYSEFDNIFNNNNNNNNNNHKQDLQKYLEYLNTYRMAESSIFIEHEFINAMISNRYISRTTICHDDDNDKTQRKLTFFKIENKEKYVVKKGEIPAYSQIGDSMGFNFVEYNLLTNEYGEGGSFQTWRKKIESFFSTSSLSDDPHNSNETVVPFILPKRSEKKAPVKPSLTSRLRNMFIAGKGGFIKVLKPSLKSKLTRGRTKKRKQGVKKKSRRRPNQGTNKSKQQKIH